MHVVVMGAGVVGVTTAWYLRQQGHDVTVLDRRQRRPPKPRSPMAVKSRCRTPSHGPILPPH